MCVCVRVCCYYSKTRVSTTVRFRSARTQQCYRDERTERLGSAVRSARTAGPIRPLDMRAGSGRRVVARRDVDVVSRRRAGSAWLLTRSIVRGCPPPSLLRSSRRRQPAIEHQQIKEIPFYLFPILFLGSHRHDIVIPRLSSFNDDYERHISNIINNSYTV